MQRWIVPITLGAKKLFVITLLCGLPKDDLRLVKAMVRFRKARLHDSSLPIKPEGCPAFVDAVGTIHSPWTGSMVRNFGEKQWAVLAPVLTDENTKLTLKPGHIFPMVGDVGGGAAGAFGRVVRVTIHERHWPKPLLRVEIPTTRSC